jgi:uncharacterized protein YdeI (YjbR/CyaY-like superfamily)
MVDASTMQTLLYALFKRSSMKNTEIPNLNLNPQVTAYLADCAEFAQPIMNHLRRLLHATCPSVVEQIKWGIPHFDYHGDMMCIFAAHAKHCSFTFFKQAIMSDSRLRENLTFPAAKRYLGKITSLADLPSDRELIAFIKEAMALNEKGIKLMPQPAKTPAVMEMPAEFALALTKNPQAKSIFDTKAASFRKEYLLWIIAAKTDATREARIEEAISWIAQDKGRFWKYQK